MTPQTAAGIERHTCQVSWDGLCKRDHVLAVDRDDERHTHTEWPSAPAVLGTMHIEAAHVTVVSLLVATGQEPTLMLGDGDRVTVYRPPW